MLGADLKATTSRINWLSRSTRIPGCALRPLRVSAFHRHQVRREVFLTKLP